MEGRAVLEVGALDVNGSARPAVERLSPISYVGVDIEDGPNVDRVVDGAELVSAFGASSFDVVIATEVVEHVRQWRAVFSEMKAVLRPGGLIVVTTRSPGFHVHAYPWDYWRYTGEDMRRIFSDFSDVYTEDDTTAPGIFVSAVKPVHWAAADLAAIRLYSVVARRPMLDISDAQVARFKIKHKAHVMYRRALPESARAPIKHMITRLLMR